MCQSWDKGLDSLYFGKWRNISKSHYDLDLHRTMSNVELVRATFKYYNMFKFQVHGTIIFLVIMYTDTHTHTDTDGKTCRHTDGHEYSVVAVDKIILMFLIHKSKVVFVISL